jgi:hypothetical protein
VKNSKTRLLLAVIFGVAGGLLSSLAYPTNAIWVAIIPAVALILYAISIVKPAQSLLVGFFAGVAFYASQIPWMTVYLGPVPWLALSVLEGVIFALGSFALALAFKGRAELAKTTFFSNVNLASDGGVTLDRSRMGRNDFSIRRLSVVESGSLAVELTLGTLGFLGWRLAAHLCARVRNGAHALRT